MEKEIWVTEKEVSRMTGVAVQTLRNYRCKCVGIPYSKAFRSVRYKVQDVLQFMEQNKVVPGGRVEA